MRFAIRDLLWLMVVVALALGWWLDHRRQDQRWDALLKRINPPLPQYILDDTGLKSAKRSGRP